MIDQPLNSLEDWVHRLSQETMPVLARTAKEFNTLRSMQETLHFRQVFALIIHDPLMTLQVLRFLQEHRSARQTSDVTTLPRAFLMVGTTSFFDAFEQLPLLEDKLAGHPDAWQGLSRVLSRSYHAALYAAHWAEIHHDHDPDEIATAAALAGITETMLYCFAPEIALQLRARQLAHPEQRSVEIQQDLLGLTLEDLQIGLLEAWAIPPLLRQSMARSADSDPRSKLVNLAVALARHSADGWYDRALPDDFVDLQRLLHLDEFETLQAIHRPCLRAAQSMNWYQWPPSARWLPLIRPDDA